MIQLTTELTVEARDKTKSQCIINIGYKSITLGVSALWSPESNRQQAQVDHNRRQEEATEIYNLLNTHLHEDTMALLRRVFKDN